MKKPIVTLFFLTFLALTFAVAASPQTSRKLKIIKKPTALAQSCGHESGVTTVRVTFDKSGIVTNAEVKESSGCSDYDDNCIAAARRIKFEPEIRDGEIVTVTKPFVYMFGINKSRVYVRD